jgi:non-ribosomal peptide synthase protein (TIGR01720 family)
VVLELGADLSAGEVLKGIKEQMRQIPEHGLGYGLLRYLNAADEENNLFRAPLPQVRFNYFGQLDQGFGSFFTLADESAGLTQNRQNPHPYWLDINALIIHGQLQMNWIYNHRLHLKTTIEKEAQQYIEQLQALITHCLTIEAGGYTPSDFPHVSLSQQELDDLLIQLDGHTLREED